MTNREKRYRQALEDIINPLGYLRRKAEEQNAKLNEEAYSISQSRQLVVDIAKEALEE